MMQCKNCGAVITAPRVFFCSQSCNKAHWQRGNKDKVAEVQRRYRTSDKGTARTQEERARAHERYQNDPEYREAINAKHRERRRRGRKPMPNGD